LLLYAADRQLTRVLLGSLTEISAGRGDRVRLLVSRRLNQPFASAWGRAVIVLPENLCGDEQALRWCVAHEWAHVDQHDFRTWLLAGLVRVLFFYQPLLWWLRRQLRLCQDFVADSQAALQAPQAEDYAEFLTARAAAGGLHPAVVGLSIGCYKSELYRRVIMLLKNESLESRTPRLWTISVTVAAVVLVTVVAAVTFVPRAVAEKKPAAGQAAATKPADKVSPASDEPAMKEGSKTESKPDPIQRLVAEPNTDEAKPIAEIEKLGGKVTVNEKSPGKPVIEVNLMNVKVTDAGLEHLKGLTQLRSLNLAGTNVVGLANLKGLTQLRSLDLSRTNISDVGLEHLKGMPQLQSLRLWQTKVTDAGLKHLKGLAKLQSLDLMTTKITDAGLNHLKGLSHLQSLNLGDTKVTDAGLEHLKGLTNLQSLCLMGTDITDAGLEHLKGLARLKDLVFCGTKVSDAGKEKFHQALPNCKTMPPWDPRQ
jgi:Leucine-rich repeat (LRR) protein